ncbi:MAG: 50S ribosomal protein L21 [Pseudomonadota bacterium]
MYAVIKSGGKQYRVAPGQTVRVEKIEGGLGDVVSLKEVLLVSDGETFKVGSPVLADAEVVATIVEQHQAKKILVFRKKRRKGYTKIQGHRQKYTALRVQEIKA